MRALREQCLQHEARMAVSGMALCPTTEGMGNPPPVQALAMLEDGHCHVAAKAVAAQLRDVAQQDLGAQAGSVLVSCDRTFEETAEDAAACEVACRLHGVASKLAAYEGHGPDREHLNHTLEDEVGIERPGSCPHRTLQLFRHAGPHGRGSHIQCLLHHAATLRVEGEASHGAAHSCGDVHVSLVQPRTEGRELTLLGTVRVAAPRLTAGLPYSLAKSLRRCLRALCAAVDGHQLRNLNRDEGVLDGHAPGDAGQPARTLVTCEGSELRLHGAHA
mmetsp:Transcript_90679/g.234152  ORF Transcript_90679/g.234152 Transcript_90679/m.234152 type:complete len:275 (-) Transcript_90679:74-898(-)